MYCQPLSELLNPQLAGGKASSLSVMLQHGMPVPDGFVILTPAFERFSTEPDLGWLEEELSLHMARLNSGRYMVRSSAVGEDGVDGSFAGQLSSFISGPDMAELKQNIARCWQSYHQQNVQVYQQQKGVQLQGMAVVVQQLIEPDFAGVLFTRALTNPEQMLCEYVHGHGEQLVSGHVNPDRFHASRSTGAPDFHPPFRHKELLRLALKLEETYEQALDVEWVISKGKTWLVQARPITAQAAAQKVYWSNTNVNENYPTAITPLLYSIARDSYYHYFKNLATLLQIPRDSISRLEADFSNVIGVFGCRMYYNMSSIHRIISCSPFSGLLRQSFDNFVGYQEEKQTGKSAAKALSSLRFLWSFLRLNLKLEKHVQEFEKRADNYHRDSLSAASLPELRQLFHGFIEIRMHSWYRASLADFFAMVFHGLLGKFCAHHFPGKPGIHNTLIQAIPGLVSSKPVTETWKIAQLVRQNEQALELLLEGEENEFLHTISHNQAFAPIHIAIQNYLKNWGFRCSGELMFTECNFCEKPVKFVELLRGYVQQSHESPKELIAKRNEDRMQLGHDLKRQLVRKKPLLFPAGLLKSAAFSLLIGLCTTAIAARERVRLKQALLYYRFKTVALKLGRIFVQQQLLENEQDVLFLKYQEIAENLTGSDMLPQPLQQIVQLRKQQFSDTSQLIYPDDFSTRLGQYPMPDEVQTKPPAEATAGLKGLCACGGFVKGRARVLESIMELHRIEKGDILVTRQTDPGWASIFPLIKGLVVERGGMLSHGAIVAREFGIPAIVGVPGATSLIDDGEEIILNADTGEIYRNVAVAADLHTTAV